MVLKTVKRYSYLFLCAIPLFALCAMLIRYSANIPFWDEWELISILDKINNGTLTFYDLWIQHNEHRIFFPKIIMLTLAIITNWNVYFELAVNVILGILIFCAVLISIKKTTEITAPKMLIIFSSFLIFSFIQWENWIWGWQIQIFLNILMVFISLLSFHLHNIAGYFTSIISGFIATFSFANGILVWPILILMLVIHPLIDKEAKVKRIAFFSVVFLINVLLFYYDYHIPESNSSIFYSFSHPLEFIGYILAYLGSPLAGFEGIFTIVFGGVGLVIYLVIAYHVITNKSVRTEGMIFWLSASLYPIFSAMISALGRVVFGYEQALASRYTTISIVFWLSLTILVIMCTDYFKGLFRLSNGYAFNSIFKTIFLTVVIISFAYNSLFAYRNWIARYYGIKPLETELISCNESNYTHVYPEVDTLKSYITSLSNLKMSVFSFKNQTVYEIPGPSSGIIDTTRGDLNARTLTPNGCLYLSGWVVDAEKNSTVDQVVAVVNNEIVMESPVNIDRPDVADVYKNPDFINSGWQMEIRGQFLPYGESSIDLYGIREKNKAYFKIGTVNVRVMEGKDPSTIEVAEFVNDPAQGLGVFDNLNYDGTYLSGSGWAVSPLPEDSDVEVIITDANHHILAHAWVMEERADIADHFQDESKRISGWSFISQISGLKSGTQIFAYVYLPEENKAYRLHNEFSL